ncbi:MAG: twin-arginine translocase subunit TatC [Planctomycetaceae bacterium]
MDRPALPKDDLFENSTMTFGEHLEELRRALAKALLWLMVGMAIGLGFFADRVIRYVQTPLEVAIRQFNADRDLARMRLDAGDPEVQPLREFLMNNGLVWELVYDIPREFLTAVPSEPSGGVLASDPAAMAEILQSLPAPEQLQPRLQLRRLEIGLSALKIEEPFMIWVKAGLIVGAVLASPMMFYHLWNFVAAGLHSHERGMVYLYLPISVGLFVSGVCLAFFVVLQFVISFLLTFNGELDVAVEPRLSYYISFVLLLPLGFGIAFQLPLVMLFIERIGLVETKAYVDSWRVAILVIAVVSVVLTPADITSMLAMMVPLVVLYFVGIAMCKYLPRGRGLGSQAYDPR